jgi:hypothetical protein
MMAFLAQGVFAARNEDFEGWSQILIVVIMAVVYGISGILKAAKSKKLEDKEGPEQEAEAKQPFDHAQGKRPAGDVIRRVYEAYKAYQEASQPKRTKTVPDKRILQRQAKAERAAVIVPKKPQIEPQLEVKIQEAPEITTEIEKPPDYSGEPFLDVSDPEVIRRAILHYEIFGKPLALREQ